MLKEIFEKIKDREWDWFGENEEEIYEKEDHCWISKIDFIIKNFSLADLLANKSWCIAVWGEIEPSCTFQNDPYNGEQICFHCDVATRIQPSFSSGCNHAQYPDSCKICWRKRNAWEHFSEHAFRILQEKDKQACLAYILNTML